MTPSHNSSQPLQRTLDQINNSRNWELNVDHSEAYHDPDHELNPNWNWSRTLVETIKSELTGLSLKVCPGFEPIGDVNVDIKPLTTIATHDVADFTIEPLSTADSELVTSVTDAIVSPETDPDSIILGRVAADEETADELYDGLACYGDAFDLPFADSTFQTTVSDPPWLNLTKRDRETLFKELIRVTKPTGKIIYNSPWFPTHEDSRQYDTRARQQQDYWGGTSFISFYRCTANNHPELFDVYEYTPEQTTINENSPVWTEPYHPNSISPEHNTNPNIVNPLRDNHNCPKCGCTKLEQCRGDSIFVDSEGKYDLYQCADCGFRARSAEITASSNNGQQTLRESS